MWCAAIAVVGAVVETVSVAVPLAEIVPKLQVGGLLVVGPVTVHDRATVVGSSPPAAVIVTVEVLDAPADTEPGESADAPSVNPEAATTRFPAGETLAT